MEKDLIKFKGIPPKNYFNSAYGDWSIDGGFVKIPDGVGSCFFLSEDQLKKMLFCIDKSK